MTINGEVMRFFLHGKMVSLDEEAPMSIELKNKIQSLQEKLEQLRGYL